MTGYTVSRVVLKEDASSRVLMREVEGKNSSDDSAYSPCYEKCSWDLYLDNEKFKETVDFREHFGIDDDQKVTALRSSLACIPFTFGYSQARGNEVFPPVSYPTCQSKITEEIPLLDLQPTANWFNMSCSKGDKARFVVKPERLSPTEFNTYVGIEDWWVEKEFKGPEEVDSEYVLAACESKYTNAQLLPKFNSTAYLRASQIISQRSPKGPIRPIIILFLTLDSFSRRHFFRKMPRTTELLNDLNSKGQFAVFDFKLHNIMGRISPENMVPMFWNQTLIERVFPYAGDQLGKEAIWAILKEKGFVTATGFENCGSDFLNFIGKKQNVDHFVNAFYCAAKKFMGLSVIKTEVEQRCLGPRMSHTYILNYIRNFSRLYAGVNQFMYFHIDTAHEQTGQHAGLLDPDLKEFLQLYIGEFAETHDLSIFLQADHGMRYGAWHTDLEAEQEMKLPALFFLTQSSLLDRLPHSYDALWHNTFRLVSKRDFRATILALGDVPFNVTYERDEEYLRDAVVLFREKAKDSRTCASVHVTPWNCGCLDSPLQLPMNQSGSDTKFQRQQRKLATKVVNQAIAQVNAEVFTPMHLPSGYICQRLSLHSLVRAFIYSLDEYTEQIRVEFSVNESETARFETLALVSSDRGGTIAMSLQEAETQPMPFATLDLTVKVTSPQVLYTSRKDRYAGPCEKLSKFNSLRAELCLCHDVATVREQYPQLSD